MQNRTHLLSPLLFLCVLAFNDKLSAQGTRQKKAVNTVYIDKQGVLRYTADNKEAAFYGVNYTTPFAYAYRAHKALGVDLEKAIKQDVYHFARLGFNAFRVHVWDTEISDTAGNLLENDHLRLFDFLLAELKKRNIKTIITPIAFWGNGYPERDERTPGFARKYGKGGSTTNDTAIRAQENYLQQFFRHVNPYTKQSYQDDPDVLAVEINNEPSHSGPKAGVTNYINRLAAAIKSTGWTKPVFYNISQGPYYADAVAASVVQGFSFQWYPSGLVSGRTLKGNFLPHVDHYNIPFDDTIPAFSKKALMVYEFDAADIAQSVMYPAMAKSFRGAGFQWATQFAYDPMALAYGNTEYQTHYLNLAYTPSKAISMMIAAEVFRTVPRGQHYRRYPSGNPFDVFDLNYRVDLSEMNSGMKFYYSNTTFSKPINIASLQHIAGVGTSPVVQYGGSGAYFLDKLGAGMWRLEVMPEAIPIRDPFERASPKKNVTAIQWREKWMKIDLPDLGDAFSVSGLNEGNNYVSTAKESSFTIKPGTYLLQTKGKKIDPIPFDGPIGLNEFVAPPPSPVEWWVRHEPVAEITGGKQLIISAIITGIDTGRVTLQLSRLGGGPTRNIPMTTFSGGLYNAKVPEEMLTPGQLSYRILLQEGNEYVAFPGNIKGNPFAWDNYQFDTWKTNIVEDSADVELYNASADRNIFIYPSFRRNFQSGYTTAQNSGELVLRLSAAQASPKDVFGMQYYVGDRIMARHTGRVDVNNVIVRARAATGQPVTARIALIDREGATFSAYCTLTNEFRDIALPLSDFKVDSSLLLPAPYPGFQPQWFKANNAALRVSDSDVEKIEILTGPGLPGSGNNTTISVEIESVRFSKRK